MALCGPGVKFATPCHPMATGLDVWEWCRKVKHVELQQTSSPLQLSLHSQTCSLGLRETEIGAIICAIGTEGTFISFNTFKEDTLQQ